MDTYQRQTTITLIECDVFSNANLLERTKVVTILLLGAQEMLLHCLLLSMQLSLSHLLISSLSVGGCWATGADLDAMPLSHLLAAMSTLPLLASSENAFGRHPCC